jgi:hypothetical protein
MKFRRETPAGRQQSQELKKPELEAVCGRRDMAYLPG